MKKLIAGLVVGLMIGLSTNAFAAIGDIVQAKFASFNYLVNGGSKTIESPVLVYEGTSYLRTTDIANMLGYDVTYKADSRTIEFDKPEPVATPTPISKPISDVSTSKPVTVGTPVINETPAVTASPTPTPTMDNKATCQAIDKEYIMPIWDAEQRDLGKAASLKYYYKQAKDNAGCL